ncbi:hypothetical protein KSP40_PGU020970 [Platanthera guangdongensis]|uniref:Late embryogenesis abundant protein LEA-2 subgroup domain-containing protein n=1 Tax=Platanthera guangdongensis TaxID=2320717 RepID=A0ABR2N2B8_9ASPA
MSNQYAGDGSLRPPSAQGHRQLAGPSSSWTQSCSDECVCNYASFFLIFLMLLPFMIYYIFQPRTPEFDLDRVDVEYFRIAPNDVGGAGGTASPSAVYLSLNITLRFISVNNDWAELLYEATNICVLYHGVPLGNAVVRGFQQPRYSTRPVDSKVIVSRFNMLQVDSPELVRDASVNDGVELLVTANATWKITGRRTDDLWDDQVHVNCFVVLSPRNQSLAYKNCDGARKIF